jgi:hypothetical protein
MRIPNSIQQRMTSATVKTFPHSGRNSTDPQR